MADEARPSGGGGARRGAKALFGPGTFIVRLAGDGMAPRFLDGDYLHVDPDEPARDGR